MNNQYSNSKLAAAINGMSSSSISSQNISQPSVQQQQQPQTTTDAVIVQSNSSVVSDEFLMQLQVCVSFDYKSSFVHELNVFRLDSCQTINYYSGWS